LNQFFLTGGVDSDPVDPSNQRAKWQRHFTGEHDARICPGAEQTTRGCRSYGDPGQDFLKFLNRLIQLITTNQMKIREIKWAAERLAFQEEDRQNQQMILDLQKENWKLKVNTILLKFFFPFIIF
jgi:hypothetical protein